MIILLANLSYFYNENINYLLLLLTLQPWRKVESKNRFVSAFLFVRLSLSEIMSLIPVYEVQYVILSTTWGLLGFFFNNRKFNSCILYVICHTILRLLRQVLSVTIFLRKFLSVLTWKMNFYIQEHAFWGGFI